MLPGINGWRRVRMRRCSRGRRMLWQVVGLDVGTCRVFGPFNSRLVGLDVGPEAVFVGHIGHLAVDAVVVAIAVASLHLMGMCALLLPPLLVSVIVLDIVTVTVGVVVIRVCLAGWNMTA